MVIIMAISNVCFHLKRSLLVHLPLEVRPQIISNCLDTTKKTRLESRAFCRSVTSLIADRWMNLHVATFQIAGAFGHYVLLRVPDCKVDLIVVV